MLIRTRIVDSTLYKADVLLLTVVLHLVETNILCWDLGDLAGNMLKGPLNKLVKAKHTTGWASFGVQLIEELFVGHLALQGSHSAHWSKTISARHRSHALEETIKLLQVDEPILEGCLAMTPMISAPGASNCKCPS